MCAESDVRSSTEIILIGSYKSIQDIMRILMEYICWDVLPTISGINKSNIWLFYGFSASADEKKGASESNFRFYYVLIKFYFEWDFILCGVCS